MSGGHFNYKQFEIQCIGDEVEQLIIKNDSDFSSETIEEFKIGLEHLRKAAVYAQRIDWLVSGDDGEDTFHSRLQKDLKSIQDIE